MTCLAAACPTSAHDCDIHLSSFFDALQFIVKDSSQSYYD